VSAHNDTRPWEREAARLAREREAHPLAAGQRGSWLVTRPGRYARPVTAAQVRDTIFKTAVVGKGYDVRQVDVLLGLVAEELDAGRPAEPLIRNAAFRTRLGGYEIDAVDWFLGQLLLLPDPVELAGLSVDPWRDLDVAARFTPSGAGDRPDRSAPPSQRALRKYFSQECSAAWREFDRQPGTYLRWATARRELHTMEGQTLASARGHGRFVTVSAGHRRFTVRKMNPARSSAPGIAEIVARSARDIEGHFSAHTWYSQWAQADARGRKLSPAQLWGDYQFREALRFRALVDETGTPVLYTSGQHHAYRAKTSISFPDQRWLRFPVRQTGEFNAVMTAVDEAGNSVVRYRYRLIPRTLGRDFVEITVHPDWELTEELVLAIAMSAPWLRFYDRTGGG
jgi:DivIVA domain-containing protein